jgi:hypothetical protein
LQITIYKNGQINSILKIKKIALYKDFWQIAIYKNGIIASLQIIKIPLYRDFWQFIKTAKLLQFC